MSAAVDLDAIVISKILGSTRVFQGSDPTPPDELAARIEATSKS